MGYCLVMYMDYQYFTGMDSLNMDSCFVDKDSHQLSDMDSYLDFQNMNSTQLSLNMD